MKIIDGAIAELGLATPLASLDLASDQPRPIGARFAFARLQMARDRSVRLEQVLAGAGLAARLVVGSTGRFAFYRHGESHVLCGFSDGAMIEIASAEEDPAAIEAEAQRTRGKRKIAFGVVLIPTIIGLFFAPDLIRAGRAILRANPRPRRPSEGKIRRKLAR